MYAADIGSTQESRFDEALGLNYTYDKKNLEYIESIDRSFKQFDEDFVLRYWTFTCLLNTPSSPSAKDNFIKFLQEKNVTSSRNIEEFKRTYVSNKALHFYTTDGYIFQEINRALRTTDISYLLSYQFIIQDVLNQLREVMNQQTNWNVFTVYRGQQTTIYELADLQTAYRTNRPIAINSFFSASLSRETAMTFLRSANPTLFDQERKPVLFKITIDKKNPPASTLFPFADVSKISTKPEEEEVLFGPEQIFTINNIELIHENEINIFIFEMTIDNNSEDYRTILDNQLKSLLDMNMNEQWLCFGSLLIDHKRFDEAKKLYNQLLTEYNDTERKAVCYQSLQRIATAENNEHEAEAMHKKVIEMRLGSQHVPIDSTIPIRKSDADQMNANMSELMNLISQFSLDGSVNPSQDTMAQMLTMCFTLSNTLMQNGAYEMAVMYFEVTLFLMNASGCSQADPLLKPRCYMKTGDCYRKLQLNDKALQNYTWAIEQNPRLPLDEYVDVLLNMSATLETMNKHEEALHKYIEVAEIYRDNSTVGGPDEHRHIEEAIKRLTSHLSPN